MALYSIIFHASFGFESTPNVLVNPTIDVFFQRTLHGEKQIKKIASKQGWNATSMRKPPCCGNIICGFPPEKR
jgi:hypothetical protein